MTNAATLRQAVKILRRRAISSIDWNLANYLEATIRSRETHGAAVPFETHAVAIANQVIQEADDDH